MTTEDKGLVLVFEDNPNIQELLKFFFKKHGYRTATASDGLEAVALARRYAPRLIMMDLIMPGVDGIAASADLRRAGVTTPIVMLTSKPFDSDRERALAAGVSAYLLKPLDTAQLRAALRPFLPL